MTAISRLPLAMVAAMARNRVIGNAGQLPWHEPADLAHFKRTTTGHAVIMGRKTWESLGRPLPKRRNLVVTRQPGFIAAGAEVFADLTQAIAAARTTDPEPMIIGGGEIYNQSIVTADKLDITRVHHTFDADTFFPEIDLTKWELTFAEFHPKDEKHQFDFTFQTYLRKI